MVAGPRGPGHIVLAVSKQGADRKWDQAIKSEDTPTMSHFFTVRFHLGRFYNLSKQRHYLGIRFHTQPMETVHVRATPILYELLNLHLAHSSQGFCPLRPHRVMLCTDTELHLVKALR